MDMGRAFNAGRGIARTEAEKKRTEAADTKLISDLLGSNETLKSIAVDKLTSLPAEDRRRIIDKMRQMEQDRSDKALIAEILNAEAAKKGAAVEKLSGLLPEDKQRIVGKMRQMSEKRG